MSVLENSCEVKQNLICVPFAFKEDANSGVNVKGDKYNVYLKNACVALCSAKYYNPECEVALVTNISSHRIAKEYTDVLNKFGVSIIEIPFDSFVFPGNYLWSLAFYKLCVLKHLSERDYANICYMDTDVYVQSNMDCLWQECEQNIMLYDINHGLQVEDYNIICEEFETYFGSKNYLTHFGGEFFAANSENAKSIVISLESVYNNMIKNNILTTKGDEFILSIAADTMRESVKNAGAYIYRFWTSPGFRLVSTSFEYNPIMILHLPNEKNKGIIKLYHSFIRKGKIPSNNTVWRKCRLNSFCLLDRIKRQIKQTMSK